jgi:hypothetical protein
MLLAGASNRHFLIAALLVFAATSPCVAANEMTDQPEIIPAKTALHFHVTRPLSSDKSETGQPFQFVLLEPVMVNERTILAAGSTGNGTLILAGHAGTSGHEGDLTLRLDSIVTADYQQLMFADQRLRINGRNKKIMSGALGFIPFAGIGARFIRGQEVQIETNQPIVTVLDRDASTLTALPSPVPRGR